MSFTEAQYENAIIELFTKQLGYTHIYGPDVDRDYRKPYNKDLLFSALLKINKHLPQKAINEAIFKIRNFDTVNTVQANEIFTDYLQNGVPVSYSDKGETKNAIVKLIDYEKVHNNDFNVINQWTFIDIKEKRPDVIVFINGLPLVIIELKSCSREEVDTSQAYTQIRNYIHDIPTMFYYNAFCVISDLKNSFAGTITSDETRFMEWKTVTGDYEETKIASFRTLFEGMFQKERLLDIIKNFILFNKDGVNTYKILAGYHQYYAVKKAVQKTKQATETDGRGGVFWHTQGSGKSLSMVFYAKLLRTVLNSVTCVVLTDRKDLDGQLYTQFSNCKEFLRQDPQQATDRAKLRELLEGRVANGIFFTTMQKFEEYENCLSERRDIVLISDEAHRSQYGLTERVKKDGSINIGYARLVRNSFPNGTFIGFTGTPISLVDRSTNEVFGNYIDIYDMTQAVKDGATKPVFYENRVMKLDLNQDVLKQIDEQYATLSDVTDEITLEKSKKQLGTMDAVLGSDETLHTLCNDIINHYEDRKNLLTGKAMIVAYSRAIAIKIYQKLSKLKPEWKNGVLEVVITGANTDSEEWKDIIGQKSKKELANLFKDNDSKMKIAIVVDMWLTGFDVPSLSTMYIYKPMQGHNLMQAIARVNRVFKDKEGGLVVDYIGIAQALKQAMNDFTKRDQNNFSDNDIAKTAYPKFKEKLEVCRDLFHGFDYKYFHTGSDLDRATLISNGANFILQNNKQKDIFIKEALLLKQGETLCRSVLSKDERMEFAFFEAVRIILTQIQSKGKLSLKELNKQISEFLKHAVKSEGIINLFKEESERVSLFDERYIEELAKMKQKNLAVELLEKLLNEQVIVYQRTNLVKSELFSERMKRIMNSYRNGQITNAEVISELLKMAQEMKVDDEEGNKYGFTKEEKAFYDAISKPENIKDFYDNESLVAITKELTENLKKSRTIDWQIKENARAAMRVMVKRLLKKYGYPPDQTPYALDMVIKQCEQWADRQEDF